MLTRRLVFQVLSGGLAAGATLRWSVAGELPISTAPLWRINLETQNWNDVAPKIGVLVGDCEAIRQQRAALVSLVQASRNGPNSASEQRRLAVKQLLEDIQKTQLPEANKQLVEQNWEVAYAVVGWALGAVAATLLGAATAGAVATGAAVAILSVPVISLVRVGVDQAINGKGLEKSELLFIVPDAAASRWRLIGEIAKKNWPAFLEKTVAKLFEHLAGLWEAFSTIKTAADWTLAKSRVTALTQQVTQLLDQFAAVEDDPAWWANAHAELMSYEMAQLDLLGSIMGCSVAAATPDPPSNVTVQ